jgi:protein kinase A
MGCTASSPPTDKYVFHYKGEGVPDATPSSRSSSASSDSPSVKLHPDPSHGANNSSQQSHSKHDANDSGDHKRGSVSGDPLGGGNSSKARASFKKARIAVSASNAFEKSSSERKGGVARTRSAAKSPHHYSWIADSLPIGSNTGLEKFELKRVIGRGLMGTVSIARFKATGTFCAVKAVSKHYVIRHDDGRHIRNELALLKKLNSPFCITLFGTFQDKKTVYFVMEYAAGGELFSRLHRKGGLTSYFSEGKTRFYGAEIISALAHIHGLGYCYRDLKPENIMLSPSGHCLLIDFGFSMAPDAQGLLHTNVGTPCYLSPEQLNHKRTGGYKSYVDFWAFGCVLFEFMTGKTPFCKDPSDSNHAIYLRVLAGKISYPGWFSSDMRALIKGLLTADVEKRLTTAKDIMAHSFFTGVNFERVGKLEAEPPHVPKLREEGDEHYFDKYPDLPEKEYEKGEVSDQSIFSAF